MAASLVSFSSREIFPLPTLSRQQKRTRASLSASVQRSHTPPASGMSARSEPAQSLRARERPSRGFGSCLHCVTCMEWRDYGVLHLSPAARTARASARFSPFSNRECTAVRSRRALRRSHRFHHQQSRSCKLYGGIISEQVRRGKSVSSLRGSSSGTWATRTGARYHTSTALPSRACPVPALLRPG